MEYQCIGLRLDVHPLSAKEFGFDRVKTDRGVCQACEGPKRSTAGLAKDLVPCFIPKTTEIIGRLMPLL